MSAVLGKWALPVVGGIIGAVAANLYVAGQWLWASLLLAVWFAVIGGRIAWATYELRRIDRMQKLAEAHS